MPYIAKKKEIFRKKVKKIEKKKKWHLFEVKLLVFSGSNKKRSRKELSQELALKLTFGNKYRQKKKKQ